MCLRLRAHARVHVLLPSEARVRAYSHARARSHTLSLSLSVFFQVLPKWGTSKNRQVHTARTPHSTQTAVRSLSLSL